MPSLFSIASEPLRARIALSVLALVVAQGCSSLDIGIDPPDAASDAPDDGGTDDGSACFVPEAGWQGCAPSGCLICRDRTTTFPLYFKNHPHCAASDDCRGLYATCGGDCPAPAATDQCDGTSGQWGGCRGSGCTVCTELVVAYPNYFGRHPDCIPNPQCKNEYFTCSAACPAPTVADR